VCHRKRAHRGNSTEEQTCVLDDTLLLNIKTKPLLLSTPLEITQNH